MAHAGVYSVERGAEHCMELVGARILDIAGQDTLFASSNRDAGHRSSVKLSRIG
jgi:hypothetical protein